MNFVIFLIILLFGFVFGGIFQSLFGSTSLGFILLGCALSYLWTIGLHNAGTIDRFKLLVIMIRNTPPKQLFRMLMDLTKRKK